jgi:NAD(P)-dependent dehydrogenase (short-subunit alcohol dehydrogenase family)
MSETPNPGVVLVTGASRGSGRAIVEALLPRVALSRSRTIATTWVRSA